MSNLFQKEVSERLGKRQSSEVTVDNCTELLEDKLSHPEGVANLSG